MSYSDQHYGAGDPDCPKCHGIGYLSYKVPDDHPYFGKVFDCDCRQADADSERMERLRRLSGLDYLASKTFETFNPQGVGAEGLPEAYRNNLYFAYERALQFAGEPQGWLILQGGYGCGKTHLAAAIANARIDAGQRIVFMTTPDLLDHLKAAFDPLIEESYSDRFEELKSTPLLILDDLGVESRTSWAMEKLYQLLNHRYLKKLPTVITTNLRLDQFDERIRSRLMDQDLTQFVGIKASDQRQALGAGGGRGDMDSLSTYRHMRFDNFLIRKDLPQSRQDNLKYGLHHVMQYAENPSEKWLVIIGPHGTGKTHLAASIAQYQLDLGNQVLFISVTRLLDYLKSTYQSNSIVSFERRFTDVLTIPLLVLDDLDINAASAWAKEKLHQLIDERYHKRLSTVITTTYQLGPSEDKDNKVEKKRSALRYSEKSQFDNLEEADPRILARIRDKRICTIVAITAPTYVGTEEVAS